MNSQGKQRAMGQKHTNTLAEKPKRKKVLGRHSHREKDDLKMHLKDMGWEGVDFIHLGQDRDQLLALVNEVMNFRVP
jgi:hypothetical protein